MFIIHSKNIHKQTNKESNAFMSTKGITAKSVKQPNLPSLNGNGLRLTFNSIQQFDYYQLLIFLFQMFIANVGLQYIKLQTVDNFSQKLRKSIERIRPALEDCLRKCTKHGIP